LLADFSRARLTSRRDVGSGLSLLTFAVGAELQASYTRPAQYVRVQQGADEGHFVLASDPGSPEWEILVRNAGEVALHLLSAPIGTDVLATRASGPGFPMEKVGGKPLVIAVVASAIGAARSVIRMRVRENDAASTHLYLGARDAGDLPLVDEMNQWRAFGVNEVVCISQSGTREGAAAGYVQKVLAERMRDQKHPSETVVFTAGPPEMMLEIESLGRNFGFSVYTNV